MHRPCAEAGDAPAIMISVISHMRFNAFVMKPHEVSRPKASGPRPET
jgi:hypothetical protein